ncbi:MAG TPA: hypothetical protein VMF30_05030 [Pirellulales bacterium]|nr:hypothetical protein [Pirellulales bacterium]
MRTHRLASGWLAAGFMALVVWSLAGSPASAQPDSPRQRGGGPNFGLAQLAGNKSVQEELKLTSDQVERLEKVAEEGRPRRSEFRDLSDEDRRKKMREFREANEKKVAEIVSPEQLKRLKQIRLQLQAPWSFTSEPVEAELKLSEEQSSKIESITKESQESMQGLFNGASDFKAAMKEAAKLRDVANEKIVGLLTSEQRDKWKELTGETFTGEIDFPGRGPGGRNRN